VKRRYDKVLSLADELCSQRSDERIGSLIDVLVDFVDGDTVEGRAAHQAPEVDGSTMLEGSMGLKPGDLVQAKVLRAEGVDLVAEPVAMLSAVVTSG
jgi:tRNA A37 methylthiotransferase MiaB